MLKAVAVSRSRLTFVHILFFIVPVKLVVCLLRSQRLRLVSGCDWAEICTVESWAMSIIWAYRKQGNILYVYLYPAGRSARPCLCGSPGPPWPPQSCCSSPVSSLSGKMRHVHLVSSILPVDVAARAVEREEVLCFLYSRPLPLPEKSGDWRKPPQQDCAVCALEPQPATIRILSSLPPEITSFFSEITFLLGCFWSVLTERSTDVSTDVVEHYMHGYSEDRRTRT